MVPSVKNTASIFPEIFFIQHFTVLVHDAITFLIIVNISKTIEDIPRRKTSFLLILKSNLNKQQLFFHFMGTLNWKLLIGPEILCSSETTQICKNCLLRAEKWTKTHS